MRNTLSSATAPLRANETSTLLAQLFAAPAEKPVEESAPKEAAPDLYDKALPKKRGRKPNKPSDEKR